MISSLVCHRLKSRYTQILDDIYQNIIITRYHINFLLETPVFRCPRVLVYLSKRFGQFINITTENGGDQVDLVMALAKSCVIGTYSPDIVDMHKLLNVLGSKLQIRPDADNKYAFDYFKADEKYLFKTQRLESIPSVSPNTQTSMVTYNSTLLSLSNYPK